MSDELITIHADAEVEMVAKAIYLSFFVPEWPPKRASTLGVGEGDFRRAARNVLMVLQGKEPDYDDCIRRRFDKNPRVWVPLHEGTGR